MLNVKSIALSAVLVCSMLVSAAVSAQEYRTQWTTVERLLVHEDEFGGCLAMVAEDVATASGGMCTQWAAFSCTGELNEIDTALRMFESAQIAYLTRKEVRMTLDSSRTHNGHCVATRFDYR